ncbi:NADPH-dependent F420 reductase [Glutamicibacter sp. 2E12]|uniref:NADPH-dependent F420 reductase n=1 Tax=Glutamicibacter sp. 2E12 TaxID=3416181 RepID=UPI003CEBFFE4
MPHRPQDKNSEQPMSTTKIGIIGSGNIGQAIARLAVAAGATVAIANSRGTASLADVEEELGDNAHAATVAEAAEYGDIVVLAIPLSAYSDLPTQVLANKTVLSTGNYYPSRDGRIEVLDSLKSTTAQLEASLLPGARITKAFNNIVAHHIPLLVNSAPRTALPIYGDDLAAKTEVLELVQALGFDTVNAGTLADSWRAEPESGGYTHVYAQDPANFYSAHLADRGQPVTIAQLEEALATAHRADVAARQF